MVAYRVSVDGATAGSRSVVANRARLTSLAGAALLLFGAVPAMADGPAVSAINGKVSAFGGAVGDTETGRAARSESEDGLAGIAGSLTLPLSYSFGLQIDGAYARLGEDNFGSGGAHLFWRDPGKGLLGLYAGYAHLDRAGGQEIGRVGVEAQWFAGQLTYDGAVGYRFGDSDDDAYGRARIQYYLGDDLMLSGGYIYEGDSFGSLGLEYQMSNSRDAGYALFAESQINDGDNYSALGGIRIFLGESMSLKDRHRRQDPDGYTGVDMQATEQSANNTLANQSTPPTTSSTTTYCIPEDKYPITDTCVCPSGTTKLIKGGSFLCLSP